MRCHTGKVALLLERSPFEAYEADRLIACDVLPENNGSQLSTMVAPNEWRRML